MPFVYAFDMNPILHRAVQALRKHPQLNYATDYQIGKWWLMIAIERLTLTECVSVDLPNPELTPVLNYSLLDRELGHYLIYSKFVEIIRIKGLTEFKVELFPSFHGFLILG